MIDVKTFNRLIEKERRYWSRREETEYVKGVICGLRIAADQIAINSRSSVEILSIPVYKGNRLYNAIKAALAYLRSADRKRAIHVLETTLEHYHGHHKAA